MIITGAGGLDCEKMDEENDVRHSHDSTLGPKIPSPPMTLHLWRGAGVGGQAHMRSPPSIQPNADAEVQ